MYEFTNGIVVFDEKTRDRYIEAGYRLDEKTIVNNKKQVVLPEELTQDLENQLERIVNENASNDGTIGRKSKKCNKLSK